MVWSIHWEVRATGVATTIQKGDAASNTVERRREVLAAVIPPYLHYGLDHQSWEKVDGRPEGRTGIRRNSGEMT